MNQHLDYYSFLGWLGSKKVTNIQTNYAARVYYNTRVKSNGRMIKWLYVSGRLQKLVLNVLPPTKELTEAIENNRNSASHFALLKLGDTFTYKDLFKQIVSISYNGDFRQKFDEDRSKIDKIVRGSYDKLVDIYKPFLIIDNRITILSSKIEQDNTTKVVYHRLNLLPSEILNNLQDSLKKKLDADVIISKIAEDIFYKSAISRTSKNAFSAGLS